MEELARALWRPSKPHFLQEQHRPSSAPCTDERWVWEHWDFTCSLAPCSTVWPPSLYNIELKSNQAFPCSNLYSNSRSVQYERQMQDEYRKSITLKTLIAKAVLPRDKSSSTWVNWPVKTLIEFHIWSIHNCLFRCDLQRTAFKVESLYCQYTRH